MASACRRGHPAVSMPAAERGAGRSARSSPAVPGERTRIQRRAVASTGPAVPRRGQHRPCGAAPWPATGGRCARGAAPVSAGEPRAGDVPIGPRCR
jgi:hypothetical protein